ncbi:MAG: SAM-dependent chlorinase/fluorinase [Myxococcales bacterium]|nr:SAM-dependent chlorinase/fluorinase [Myxococcales bacterium]
MSERRPLVTMITDFGTQDAYVGIMKGVIAGIAPETHIIDLSHQVSPQDVQKAAFLLWSAVEVFPAGSIHLVVVDPGVGSSRRAIAANAGGHFFVAPDNGVLWPSLQRFPKIRVMHLDKPEFWRSEVSHTFHGRDIFSPIAAHLAAGRPLPELGTPIDDPVEMDLFDVEGDGQRIWGRVIEIDRFGNLCTNISRGLLRMFGDLSGVQLHVGAHQIHGGIHQTFSDVGVGEMVAYFNSFGLLEIAARNGYAARMLDVQINAPVWLEPESEEF